MVLPQIGCGMTSKGTWLGWSKDMPSFAAVNSGRVHISNRPFVSIVSCLDSIMKVLMESFPLSGHTFSFRWTDWDLAVFLV